SGEVCVQPGGVAEARGDALNRDDVLGSERQPGEGACASAWTSGAGVPTECAGVVGHVQRLLPSGVVVRAADSRGATQASFAIALTLARFQDEAMTNAATANHALVQIEQPERNRTPSRDRQDMRV